MLTELLAASHLLRLDKLPSVVRGQMTKAGLDDPLIYLCDKRQQLLRRLDAPGDAGAVSSSAGDGGGVTGRQFGSGRSSWSASAAATVGWTGSRWATPPKR